MNLSTSDIVKMFNIKRATLQDWINRGFIKPTIPAKGKGVAAIFNQSSTYQVALFKTMLDYGISRTEATWLTSKVLSCGDINRKGILLLKIGKEDVDVEFLTNDYRILDDAKKYRKFISIKLGEDYFV